jgi:hypothetical protein
MSRNTLYPYRLFILTIAVMLSFVSNVSAETVIDALDKESFGLAIKGYDTVAYFTEGKAVKGNGQHLFTWNEAIWQFANAEHKELFAANPDKYVPHRGGW